MSSQECPQNGSRGLFRKPLIKTDAIGLTLLFASAPNRLANCYLKSLAAFRNDDNVPPYIEVLYDPCCFSAGTPLTLVISDTNKTSQASPEALNLVMDSVIPRILSSNANLVHQTVTTIGSYEGVMYLGPSVRSICTSSKVTRPHVAL
ncbi:hypothetical protein EVAR_5692_1 [Eumeta japonica]|uniref:Uncharacterized protein n=1 Tax=Eumeta variegata TaxID=151549 RepID=A0A4C1TAP7_EUMVA|nr:hypothetical protein EVAR_5692_1 [Eumeta japonica]